MKNDNVKFKSFQKILQFLIVNFTFTFLILNLGVAANASVQDDIANRQKQIEEIQRQIDEYQKQIEQT